MDMLFLNFCTLHAPPGAFYFGTTSPACSPPRALCCCKCPASCCFARTNYALNGTLVGCAGSDGQCVWAIGGVSLDEEPRHSRHTTKVWPSTADGSETKIQRGSILPNHNPLPAFSTPRHYKSSSIFPKVCGEISRHLDIPSPLAGAILRHHRGQRKRAAASLLRAAKSFCLSSRHASIGQTETQCLLSLPVPRKNGAERSQAPLPMHISPSLAVQAEMGSQWF